MEFTQAVNTVFIRKYATFSGRASRSEYWYFYLFTLLVGIAMSILDSAALGYAANEDGPFSLLFALAVLVPSLAVAVRRLHDVNRSGWWLLIGLTVVGLIFPLLYWYCKKGTEGENRYGADPLAK